jgi:hypothetical protein
VFLFSHHNVVNPYHIGIDVAEQGLFQQYLHPSTGLGNYENGGYQSRSFAGWDAIEDGGYDTNKKKKQ